MITELQKNRSSTLDGDQSLVTSIEATLTRPMISIIIPVYNVESYIESCLNSVMAQTYPHLEIIIVEDCSTDDSKIKLKPYLDDKRIKLIEHSHNKGLSAARNTGIAASTGDYTMFVDSDDLIHPQLVALCVNTALENKSDIITYQFAPFHDTDDYDLIMHPSLMDNLSNQTISAKHSSEYFTLPHFAWLKFIKSSLLQDHSIQFPVNLYYEDWPFHWHIGLMASKIHHLPIDGYLYRQRTSSITGSTGPKLLDLFKIHKLVLQLLEEHQASELKRTLANKIKQSHWRILTRIEDEYLGNAVSEAKNANQILKKRAYSFDKNPQNTLITTITHCPNNLALSSLTGLRAMLNQRRKVNQIKHRLFTANNY